MIDVLYWALMLFAILMMWWMLTVIFRRATTQRNSVTQATIPRKGKVLYGVSLRKLGTSPDGVHVEYTAVRPLDRVVQDFTFAIRGSVVVKEMSTDEGRERAADVIIASIGRRIGKRQRDISITVSWLDEVVTFH